MAKRFVDIMGLVALLLVASVVAVAAVLAATGTVSKTKISDVVKVVRGELSTSPDAEEPKAEDAAGVAAAPPVDVKSQEELRQAVIEWEKDRRAQEEAIKAAGDALQSMRRELDAVRAELDARQKAFDARVTAFEEAKAAEEAASVSQGFQEAVNTYAQMEARDVAQLLYALPDLVVVRYLKAFKVNFRAEVLTEIKKLDEASPMELARGGINRAAALQELISGGGTAATGEAADGAAN